MRALRKLAMDRLVGEVLVLQLTDNPTKVRRHKVNSRYLKSGNTPKVGRLTREELQVTWDLDEVGRMVRGNTGTWVSWGSWQAGRGTTGTWVPWGSWQAGRGTTGTWVPWGSSQADRAVPGRCQACGRGRRARRPGRTHESRSGSK